MPGPEYLSAYSRLSNPLLSSKIYLRVIMALHPVGRRRHLAALTTARDLH